MAQFTKRAIMEAFIKLLGEHPLDKITVKDIVEECGVNRNTFYYYFQDIYDLLDQLFQTELNRVLDEHRDFSTWHEAFLESVQFVFENKTAVRHLYTSLNREQLERYLYGVVDRVMLNFVQKKAEGLSPTTEDLQFVVDFYKYAIVGMILEWICLEMKSDFAELISRLEVLFHGSIRQALERSGEQADCERLDKRA